MSIVERKKFIPAIASFKKLADLNEEVPSRYNIQGVLLLQTIVSFPEKYHTIVLESYFSQSIDTLLQWCCDPMMSRLSEAILNCKNVNLKAKRKIVRTFEGHFTKLAMSSFGSHFVDACWNNSDINYKVRNLV